MLLEVHVSELPLGVVAELSKRGEFNAGVQSTTVKHVPLVAVKVLP